MKQAVKYLFGASFMVLALTACGKKDKPAETETKAAPVEETAVPTVVERPPIMCDEAGLKNRVVNLVRDQILDMSLDALGRPSNIAELEQQLKARLAQTNIDVHDAKEQQGECQAQLHISLPAKDVEFANKAFAKAGMPSLTEQAQEKNITLMGDNLLVSDFAYQADGEALAIDKNNVVIALAAKSLAKATQVMTKENKANAHKETAAVGRPKTDIVPAPTVTLRPVERPKPPTPEEAILRPEDVPSGKPRQAETAQNSASPSTQAPSNEPKAESKPKPKPETRAETENKPKEQAKPAASEPKATQETKQEPKKDTTEAEITVVESDETY